ncbi:F-box domain, FBD domain, Leucine-rich repeat domain, L domain-like protein [Artemisia annua]|uniref:F-box domain, FBD domain, Leucine-rich repeat domain, L domain-like protein n=1 Tax=Artemisia annua TaxID=35608 RepID=A0A2U1KA92_ARTAN|nr:F-box domain, FBD domain, Leucine-rich repeat domain, L domain-like protein [Artemisia annua]
MYTIFKRIIFAGEKDLNCNFKEMLTPEHWELDEVEARAVLTRHLKRVEFLELNGEEQRLGVACSLLEHGSALEEMVFSWCDEGKYHEKSAEIMNQEMLTLEHWELDEVEARAVLTRHLKRVEFLELNGEEQRLGVACSLLEHGSALEEMVFSWCDEGKYHEKSAEIMNQVSEFRKASSTIKLTALLRD